MLLLVRYSYLVGMKTLLLESQSNNFAIDRLIFEKEYSVLVNSIFIPVMCSPASASLAKKRQIREIDWTKLRQIGRKNQSSILI